MTKTIAYCTLIFPVKFDIFSQYRKVSENINAATQYKKPRKDDKLYTEPER